MKHKLFKLLHIIGIVAWLGPSSGGYLMILISRMTFRREIEIWLRQEYLSLIYLESAGLSLIIAGGLGMLAVSKWKALSERWLRMKILIVAFIFLPLELIQLYIYHGPIRKAFVTGKLLDEAITLYDKFSILALILLALTVPAVLALGVFKPWRKNAQKF